jgi:flavin reductase (DIM6/NTAB) family NADH-FMN oxidoreductase RutF
MNARRSTLVDASARAAYYPATAALVTNVCVLTARHAKGAACGLAARSVSAYSAEPPSVLVTVCSDSAFRDVERFAVNVLARDQEHVGHLFAGGRDDPFAGLEWRWDHDLPAIAGSLAVLRCVTSARLEKHDRTILVGDVVGGSYAEREPLVHCRRRMDWQLG